MPGYDRCVVKLLDADLLLLPPNSLYFYMQVSDFFPSYPAKTCVRKQRVGIYTLKNMLPLNVPLMFAIPFVQLLLLVSSTMEFLKK